MDDTIVVDGLTLPQLTSQGPKAIINFEQLNSTSPALQ